MILRNIAVLSLALTASALSAEKTDQPTFEDKPESPFNSVGFRFAVDSDTTESLTSYEIYETSDPQWSWDLGEKITTGIGYEAALGALAGGGDVAAYVHFGFTFEIAHDALPLTVVLATGPSLFTDDTFGSFDIGGHIQFTSSAGIEWQVSDRWALGYRYQHTSNAGLKSHNPGLNMHAFSVSRSF